MQVAAVLWSAGMEFVNIQNNVMTAIQYQRIVVPRWLDIYFTAMQNTVVQKKAKV